MEKKSERVANSNTSKEEVSVSNNPKEHKTPAELFEIIQSAERELQEIQTEKKILLKQKVEEIEANLTTTKDEPSSRPDTQQGDGFRIDAGQELILLKNESDKLKEEIIKTENYIKTLEPIWKNRTERKKQKEKLDDLKLELKITEGKTEITEEIAKDRKEKPFTYFAFEKCTNKILLDYYTDKFTGLINLKTIPKIEEEIRPLIPENKNERKGDLVFQFNIFGFIKIIKDIDKFVVTKNGPDGVMLRSEIYSDENIICKIIGPDGNLITPDYVNLSEADKIYREETKKRKEELTKEFKTEQLNLSKITGEKLEE